MRKPRQRWQLSRLQVSAVSDQQEERQDALRVQRVSQDFRSAVQPEGAPEDAFRRTTVQMQDVRQEFHAIGTLTKTQLRAHR